MKRFYKAIAAFSATLMPCVAMADAIPNVFADSTLKVETADLDLSTSQGKQRLDARLYRAATAVCGREVSHLHPSLAPQVAQCRAEVIADAQQRFATRHPSAQQASLEVSGAARP
jgi:UrcA family protein